MAKASKKKVVKDTLNWFEETTTVGIPTMALLPPKNFYFKVLEERHKITIPRKGEYYNLNSKCFSKEDGDFMVIEDDNSSFYISTITRVLFGLNKYPELETNQLFCPVALSFNAKTIDIFGQVICMLEPPQGKTTKDLRIK